jgi:Beta-ketoacyl synthase, N-terminal domain
VSPLSAYLDGISVIGPGLADWAATEAVLTGRSAYVPAPTVLPAALALPPVERRRTGRVVRLAIAVGLEASRCAGLETTTLLTVFTSSGGDGDNCHEICQALATRERQLSPTRFHNSVHNAAAGYWSIATGAMVASTALSAYDASFAAGLLEALVQGRALAQPILLIACDTSYPPPLHDARPLADCFGAALVLAPERGERSIARLTAGLGDRAVDRLAEPELERLRLSAPAGRSLPLLALIARRQAASVSVEYLGTRTLYAEVAPC